MQKMEPRFWEEHGNKRNKKNRCNRCVSVGKTIRVQDYFGHASDLWLNLPKTKTFWLGPWFNWPKEPLLIFLLHYELLFIYVLNTKQQHTLVFCFLLNVDRGYSSELSSNVLLKHLISRSFGEKNRFLSGVAIMTKWDYVSQAWLLWLN